MSPPSSQRGVGRGVHCEDPFSPSLMFPSTELLGNSSSLLADLLCFSKNNNKKCVLTEKKNIFQVLKKD